MKTSWRHLEDVFPFLLQKMSPRHLDQDEYILSYVFRRRLEDVFNYVLIKINMFFLAIRLEDAFKAFSRCLQDVFRMSYQVVFKTSCINVFKTFWRLTSSKRLEDVSERRLEDFLKTLEDVLVRHPEDILKTSWKTSSRHLHQDVFKTSSRRFKEVFKTSWRPLLKISLKRFQDVSLN